MVEMILDMTDRALITIGIVFSIVILRRLVRDMDSLARHVHRIARQLDRDHEDA
jgi:hypothetical protein